MALVKQRVALLDSASNSSCSDSDKVGVWGAHGETLREINLTLASE